MAERIGVLLMAYGTPAGPDDVERYYTHIRRGRPPTPELLADLQRRYQAIGGISPLLEITRAQAAGLQAALDQAHADRFRVVLGMKHASPFIEEGVAELAAAGVDRAVGLVLAPHLSALSGSEYVRRARAAADEVAAGMELTFVEQWHDAPGYLDFLADAVTDALARLDNAGVAGPHVLFTAHSLPARLLATDDPHPGQVEETAAAVAARARIERWSVAWQSAGRTEEEWLGPDGRDVIRELATDDGVTGVVVCPAGFVADHLEVLYDVDVECRQVAEEAGLAFARTAAPNADPAFVATLADVVLRHLATAPA